MPCRPSAPRTRPEANECSVARQLPGRDLKGLRHDCPVALQLLGGELKRGSVLHDGLRHDCPVA
eukprot:8599294-Heterocapsa_arctica.AAC.1